MTLKELRRKAGLRAEEVAAYVGVSYATVRNWEQGRTIPTLSILQTEKLLNLYGASFDEFASAVKATNTNLVST